MHPASRSMAIVFNPSKDRARMRAFVAQMGSQVERLSVYESSHADDIVVRAAQAVADCHSTIVAGGGDGTVLGVLNGIHGSGAVLGVLPLGTSNDFAKSLGVRDVALAADAFTSGTVKHVDVGRCTFRTPGGAQVQRLFCSTSGVGFTARLFQVESTLIMRLMKRTLGDLAWVLASLRYGFTFSASDTGLQFDDSVAHGSVWLLSVNKVDREGGMPVTPFARLDDGHLEACLVPEIGRLRRLKLLASLQRSAAHIHWAEIDYFSDAGIYNRYGLRGLRRLSLEPKQPLPVHLNGEFVGYTPATFEVVPAAQPVLSLAERWNDTARG